MKNKIKKIFLIFLVSFISFLIINLPTCMAALTPEVDLEKQKLKQNPILDKLASIPKKIINFLFIPSVSAEEGCCFNTTEYGLCQWVEEGDCQMEYGFEPNTQCSGVCRGCCVNTQTGVCNPNSAKQTCESNPNSLFELGDLGCQELSVCEKGCCTKGYEKRFTTNRTCFDIYHGEWDPSIQDEDICLNSAPEDTRGCCKYNCYYGTLGECASATGMSKSELLSRNWWTQEKCYENIDGCERCEGYGDPKCLPGQLGLFKTDNCENIYIDEVDQNCTELFVGGYCNNATEPNQCSSGECSVIFSNFNTLNDFERGNYSFPPETKTLNMPHGNSWCVFDTNLDLGNGTSAVGSRHIRNYCLYGKEYSEQCGEGKISVCIEGNGACFPIDEKEECIDKDKNACDSDLECQWIAQHSAACITNLWAACSNFTTQETCDTYPFCYWWSNWQNQNYDFANVQSLIRDAGFDMQKTLDQQVTEDEDWYGFDPEDKPIETRTHPPLCLPRWPVDFDDENAPMMCETGSVLCPYTEVFWGLDTDNKECTYEKWDVLNFERCRSIGNCGLWKNWNGQIVGEGSVKKISVGEKPNETAINQIRGRNISMPTQYLNYINQLSTYTPQPSALKNTGVVAAIGLLTILFAKAGFPKTAASAIGLIFKKAAAGTTLESSKWGFLTVTKEGVTVNAAGTVGVALMGLALIAAGTLMILAAKNYAPGTWQHNLLVTGGAAFIAAGTTLIISLTPLLTVPGIGWVAAGAGLIIFALTQLVYWLTYEDEYYVIQCMPSLGPVGAEYCGVCNEDPNRPCSKTRCEALGLGCMYNETIIVGGIEFGLADGICYSVEPDGREPYIININVEDLQGTSYQTNPTQTQGPETILITTQNGGEIPTFTNLVVNIELNERAFCMWDYESTQNISEMAYGFQNGAFAEELTETFIAHPDQQEFYVRCSDAHGFANTAEYIFKFSTSMESEDWTPPQIRYIDPQEGWNFPSGLQNVTITLDVVDLTTPINCTFSREDPLKSYDMMLSETGFECKSRPIGPSIGCEFENIPLNAEEENTFYFKCKDSANNTNLQPPGPNIMDTAESVTYYPSPPLYISSINPESGTISSGCEIENKREYAITTSGGENGDGNATCYWTKSSTYENTTYFKNTFSNTHTTNITLNSGDNDIYFRCRDQTGNIAENSTNITINVDGGEPKIVRFYKDGDLIIVTNETATCAFDAWGNDCSFNATKPLKAVNFSTSDGIFHRTTWRTEPWAIKCYDECENGKEEAYCIKIFPSKV